jgi:hypothetical protein
LVRYPGRKKSLLPVLTVVRGILQTGMSQKKKCPPGHVQSVKETTGGLNAPRDASSQVQRPP